jgi:predicted ATP-dependent endonuclease of OLD family
MHVLTSVKIENFKSFTNESVSFDNVACFVGANESGKSNLLDAIYHLSSKKQMSPFTPDDLRIGAPNYPTGEIKITYTLQLDELVIKDVLEHFPKIKGKLLSLTKRGKPNESPVWECSSDIPQSLLPDIIQINNKNLFLQNFNKDDAQKKTAKKRSEQGWFINKGKV